MNIYDDYQCILCKSNPNLTISTIYIIEKIESHFLKKM